MKTVEVNLAEGYTVMSIQKYVGTCVVLILTIWASAADAQDFSKFDNETELRQFVRQIPASDKAANAAGYAELLAMNPNKELYWDKYERYAGNDESGLYKIVRAIPASNRSANATGYARLLSLDPNNSLYRAKFEKYSRQSGRATSVKSASDLESFLAGSWCVLDSDPTYVAGPHVQKLVITPDGNYRLFSKPASAMKWTGTKQRGKMEFHESRHPETGEKYYFAVPKNFGSPKLVVDTSNQKVSWQQVTNDLGETSRNSCGRFE
mgnify:FL=1